MTGDCSSATAKPSSLSLIANSKLRDSSDLAVLELLAQAGWRRSVGGSRASDSSKPSRPLAAILSG